MPLFAIRKPLSPRGHWIAGMMALILPLAAWCIVSYVPGVWHPSIKITEPGGVDYFKTGSTVERQIFDKEVQSMSTAGKPVPQGIRVNPIFFPAPHEVFEAFYKAFVTPPQRRGEPWLHQNLMHSIRIIFWGFILS